MAEIKVYKTNEKVLIWLHRENKSMAWLAERLNQTRASISQKMKDNLFTTGDLIQIGNLGCPL